MDNNLNFGDSLTKSGDVRTWRLKSCPKCNGDMLVDRDHNNLYRWCLQCGYHIDMKGIAELSPWHDGKKRVASK